VVGLVVPHGLLANSGTMPQPSPKSPEHIASIAREILNSVPISYVYGGSKLGSEAACEACNNCLAKFQPDAKERFSSCPVCLDCSLDCSHFTELVYRSAGLKYPYITTTQMLDLPTQKLLHQHNLRDVGLDPSRFLPGDLLVYRGHVVILEKLHGKDGRGDIIHATGGRDLKGPGAGIQRERFVPLMSFRGSLLRVLRHVNLSLSNGGSDLKTPAGLEASPGFFGPLDIPPSARLRPVIKRRPVEVR